MCVCVCVCQPVCVFTNGPEGCKSSGFTFVGCLLPTWGTGQCGRCPFFFFLAQERTLCSAEGKINKRCCWYMEGRGKVERASSAAVFRGPVWTWSVCRGDEKIMLWQLALFFLFSPPPLLPCAPQHTHTHLHSIGWLWESEVMFLVPSRKRATLQVPFQLSLRDRSSYVIAWGNKWHRTRPYIIRLYANTSPQPLTFTQSWAFHISRL